MKIHRIGAWVLLAMTLTAATEFWEAKPFEQWSAKEAQRVVTGSPWAKRVIVEKGGGATLPSSDIELPARARSAAPDGPGDEPMPSTQMNERPRSSDSEDMASADVVWESALPVRQARAVAAKGSPAGDAAEYTISVSNLPLEAGQTGERNLVQGAALVSKGHETVRAARVKLEPVGRKLRITYFFSREKAFGTGDDVDFTAIAAQYRVRARFRVKDMALHGRPEL